MMALKPTHVEIVLAEDEEADADLVILAAKKFKVDTTIHVVRNGVELLKYLRKEEPYQQALPPDLIILDLNMPVKSGSEALAEIRADASLTHIPVVVLTTSDKHDDVLTSYTLHANCYIQKPHRMSDFGVVVQKIEDFWFNIAKLPTK